MGSSAMVSKGVYLPEERLNLLLLTGWKKWVYIKLEADL
jgi:hypothetical protein